MRRFFFFGQRVVPESEHKEIVSQLTASRDKYKVEVEEQKQAYLHLAAELEETKLQVFTRDERGRFVKLTK